MPVPDDVYKVDVDFTSLALQYPDFAKKLKTNRQLDFSDPESVRQLTNALLDRDFNLKIRLPDDRLCPPVPNRFNYILFLGKLVDTTKFDYAEGDNSNGAVIGLDIGTGASAIYPLLGCRQHPSWHFLATEIDSKSKDFATSNIRENELVSRIKVVDTDRHSETIIPSDALKAMDKIDFLLTNPPFYSSETELRTLAKQKARPPNSACTGAPVEMICDGGEVGFVTQLVKESSHASNRTKIQWFSSMFGKLGSVTIIVDLLRRQGCTNYAISEFVQGQKTRRWCVAWSWFALRPSQDIARGTDAVEKKYLPFPTEFEIHSNSSVEAALQSIQREISGLHEIQWRWRSDKLTGIGRSMSGDVWSRKARRKLQKESSNQDFMEVDARQSEHNLPSNEKSSREQSVEEEPQFVFKIQITSPGSQGEEMKSFSDTVIIKLRWLQGHDSTLFESFHGWLKRKLQE